MKRTSFASIIVLVFELVFWGVQLAQAQVDTAWVRRYKGGPGDYYDDLAHAIAVDGSGNVYVTGFSWGSWETADDYATIKYEPEGDTAWVRRYNGPGNSTDYAYDIAVDGSSNVYVTGWSISSGTNRDYATIKYEPNGNIAWVRRYNGPANGWDYAEAIAVDGSGNVYVTGGSIGSALPDFDYATIKYYPNGDTAWVRRYNQANGYDRASAIAVDDSGNVYVTGQSIGIGTDYDYATIKYYPNGDTVWMRIYNEANGGDIAYDIAVDGLGNVYVTGGSIGIGTSRDYATIKYYPNGDTAWMRRYNGPGNGTDCALAIAVDGSGNVYVTGGSVGDGTNGDYATIKYEPNGNTAWVKRYNGPGNGWDQPWDAIAVDDSGNVYVTGESIGSGTDYDYATIKYYPNGDTAWVRRYNGPGNDSDVACDITVDGSGNVYVTGGSNGTAGFDYATIKYSEGPPPCSYLPGDVNMALGIWPPTVIGGDVTYLVGYFIGGGQESCLLDGFWCSADINGDCLIIGGDVTALVGYFVAGGALTFCPDYEPAWPPVPDNPPSGWPNCDTPVINSRVIPTGE